MACGVYECDAVLDVIQWKDEYYGVFHNGTQFQKFEDAGILDRNDYDFNVYSFTPVNIVFEPYNRAVLHCLVDIYADEPTSHFEIEKKYGVTVINYCPLND